MSLTRATTEGRTRRGCDAAKREIPGIDLPWPDEMADAVFEANSDAIDKFLWDDAEEYVWPSL